MLGFSLIVAFFFPILRSLHPSVKGELVLSVINVARVARVPGRY